MRIYRVEHRTEKVGPWKAASKGIIEFGGGLHQSLSAHCSDYTHPGSYDDFPDERNNSYGVRYGYYCGVLRLDQVAHWFGGFFEDLQRHEMVLRVYEVPPQDVLVGKSYTQVFFKRDNEVLVEEKELTCIDKQQAA